MDLYDLFGYTQEERRLAERGLKPERKKGAKSKRRKPVQPSLFPMPADGQRITAEKENEAARGRSAETAPAISPEEVREMEEIIRQEASGMPESRHEEPIPMHGNPEGATAPAEDDDPEDAVYRSLDWETNPPINGFYEMMMSLTPERRAELRRMGKEKWMPMPPSKRQGCRRRKRKGTGEGNGTILVRAPDLSGRERL